MLFDFLFGTTLCSSISRMKRKDVITIANLTRQWCIDNLGTTKRPPPKMFLYLHKKGDKEINGCYYPKKNEIHVFPEICEDIGTLIKNIIHEYTHYLEPNKTNYDKLFEIHGYRNHPFEIKARQASDKYYKTAWKQIKNKI